MKILFSYLKRVRRIFLKRPLKTHFYVVWNGFSKKVLWCWCFCKQNIFFACPFFCIKVIVFSCGNKGLKKGYMPVAPFVNFKEMEKPTLFQVFFGMHKVNQKKFAEYENRVEYFQRTIIHHILLGLVYSWLSFDESFGTEDLRVCWEKK